MPHPTPLRSGDPKRVGQYRLTGRLEGIPSDDPIFTGVGPDDTHVSITVLRGDWALDAAARDRFAAEAAVARRVPPFCAARVLEAGLDGSQAYLVSEYVYGESLLELVSADGVRREHDLEAQLRAWVRDHGDRRRAAGGGIRHHAALRRGHAVRRHAGLGPDCRLRRLGPAAGCDRRS